MPGGEGVASLTGGNPQDVTTVASADGIAGIKVVQAVPSAGKTRVGIEVIKPDPNGIGPGTVVAKKRNERRVVRPRPLARPARAGGSSARAVRVPYSLVVANGGKADSPQVTLRATVPNTVSVVSADPQYTVQQGRDLTWVLPPVAPGEKREIRLTVKPVRRGPFDLSAVASTPDGLKAEQKISSSADTASIKVALDVPAFAPVGQPIPVRVTVTNTGAVPVENVTAWVTGADGLTAAKRDPGDPAELNVGTIAPGKSQYADVVMTAEKAGKFATKATVTADGGVTEKAESSVEARTASLTIGVAGPDRVGIGESATYTIKVKNAGDMTLSSVAVKAELPRGLNATTTTGADGGTVSGAGGFATWKLPTLNPGETKMLTCVAVGDRVGPPAALVATATVSLTGTKPLEARGDVQVTVAGLPAIELEHADPVGPVPVGEKATYRVTVRNRGTGPARDPPDRRRTARRTDGRARPVHGRKRRDDRRVEDRLPAHPEPRRRRGRHGLRRRRSRPPRLRASPGRRHRPRPAQPRPRRTGDAGERMGGSKIGLQDVLIQTAAFTTASSTFAQRSNSSRVFFRLLPDTSATARCHQPRPWNRWERNRATA